MATLKEQRAQHRYGETAKPQSHQQLPDDPLAPVPIRFTQRQTVNGPTAGWHLEDGSSGEDAGPATPPRGRGQASMPSRQTRDYQQTRVTQAYPPDYEDADEPDSRPPRSAMRYQHTLPH